MQRAKILYQTSANGAVLSEFDDFSVFSANFVNSQRQFTL